MGNRKQFGFFLEIEAISNNGKRISENRTLGISNGNQILEADLKARQVLGDMARTVKEITKVSLCFRKQMIFNTLNE